MIQSFKIDNFRCYRSAELDDLRRINLVVGQNSSGKTALLEGLFLASGNSPEVALRLRLWRGMGSPVGLALDPSTADALWGDLFFQFNRKNPVAIVLRGTGEHNRTVRIEFIQRQQSTTLQHSDAPQPVTELPIRFNWKNARGENLYVVPELTPDGLRMGSIRAGPPAVFFHSAAAQAPQEVAGRFSTLSRRNEEQAVLEALQSEFSFVEGLSVELNAGLPMVYASVRNLRQKIPLGLVSSGVSKLLALLVAIADSRGGAVFVDEIENGFYFDRLPKMWQLLERFCERNDCQIFCTTHSQECLRSLAPALAEQEDSFSLIRTEIKNQGPTLRAFHGADLLAAVEQGAELR